MNEIERKAAEVQLGVLKLQHLLLESQLKGDLSGHPFRGNQWEGGGGGGSAGDSGSSSGGAVGGSSPSEILSRLSNASDPKDQMALIHLKKKREFVSHLQGNGYQKGPTVDRYGEVRHTYHKPATGEEVWLTNVSQNKTDPFAKPDSVQISYFGPKK